MAETAIHKFFLGKGNKCCGPFSAAQIAEMKASGEYEQYSLYWDENLESWTMINLPPSPALQATNVPDQTAEVAMPEPAIIAATFVAPKGLENIHAVCHDNRNVMSGEIQSITKGGLVFVSHAKRYALPPFHAGHRLWLNLIDDESGLGENTRVEVTSFSRKNGRWTYSLKWKALPDILDQNS